MAAGSALGQEEVFDSALKALAAALTNHQQKAQLIISNLISTNCQNRMTGVAYYFPMPMGGPVFFITLHLQYTGPCSEQLAEG